MRAGTLNKRISIQSLQGGVDGFGQPLESSWTEFASVRASIIPITGNEKFLSNVDFAKTTHQIKFRFIDGINASMRAIYNGREFRFISVFDSMERNRELIVKATESINGN